MHDPAEIRATVDAYVALRAAIYAGVAVVLAVGSFVAVDRLIG